MNEKCLDAKITAKQAQEDKLLEEILRITPDNAQPIIYWHQVAQDAIRSAEKEREKSKYAVMGRDNAQRDLKFFTERLVERAAQQKAAIPLDISNLVRMASDGEITLSVSITISKGEKGDD